MNRFRRLFESPSRSSTSSSGSSSASGSSRGSSPTAPDSPGDLPISPETLAAPTAWLTLSPGFALQANMTESDFVLSPTRAGFPASTINTAAAAATATAGASASGAPTQSTENYPGTGGSTGAPANVEGPDTPRGSVKNEEQDSYSAPAVGTFSQYIASIEHQENQDASPPSNSSVSDKTDGKPPASSGDRNTEETVPDADATPSKGQATTDHQLKADELGVSAVSTGVFQEFRSFTSDSKSRAAKHSVGISANPSENRPTLRFNQLEFFQFSPNGLYELRRLSRSQILEEARDSMAFELRNRSEIMKLLHSRVALKGEENPEVQRLLEELGVSGTRGVKKALRTFLKNDLQSRDIRQVDPAFSAKPALWARHSAILVSLQGIRAIICYNKMFLFDPENRKIGNAAKIISHRLKVEPGIDNAMPFEFNALEGILIASIMQLEKEFAQLEPQFQDTLETNLKGNRLTSKGLEQLRADKQKLNYFLKQASGIQQALKMVLEEDTEMSQMYLTEKHREKIAFRDPTRHDEIEMLLESYLQVIDDISDRAKLLDEAIDDIQDLMSLHADTLRNRLMWLDLMVGRTNMCILFCSMIATTCSVNFANVPAFDNPWGKWCFLAVSIAVGIIAVGGAYVNMLMLRLKALQSN